jgi:hypothetical protein
MHNIHILCSWLAETTLFYFLRTPLNQKPHNERHTPTKSTIILSD